MIFVTFGAPYGRRDLQSNSRSALTRSNGPGPSRAHVGRGLGRLSKGAARKGGFTELRIGNGKFRQTCSGEIAKGESVFL